MHGTYKAVHGSDTSRKGAAVRQLGHSFFHNGRNSSFSSPQNIFALRHSRAAHGVSDQTDSVSPFYLINQLQQISRQVTSVGDYLHKQLIQKISGLNGSRSPVSILSGNAAHTGIEMCHRFQSLVTCPLYLLTVGIGMGQGCHNPLFPEKLQKILRPFKFYRKGPTADF